jgi:hypothetical protein
MCRTYSHPTEETIQKTYLALFAGGTFYDGKFLSEFLNNPLH